ncbi:galactose-specific lectin nattectin-like [Melanotaenia boesemani]|uniref:galactose-specific lectin nattectin-like n=1 Tax=Melanotaenia boesemani TaxID=1250792 RepID=UPI001C051171|nr:galactose-specific lectin nattectin-like [Melanotaenia boesemani]
MASCLLFTLLFCGMFIGANTQCASRASFYTCSPGWTRYGHHCYQFHRTERNWVSAEHVCALHRGTLASIKNTATYIFLTNFIHGAVRFHKRTWVGGHYVAKYRVWQWTDGSRFVFNGWGRGEPNNVRGREHCMEMNRKGAYFANDEGCWRRNSFVCQKRATKIW